MKPGRVDLWAYGFVAPAVLILAVGHIYPILWLILLSGQETDVLRNTHAWTGLANCNRFLTIRFSGRA